MADIDADCQDVGTEWLLQPLPDIPDFPGLGQSMQEVEGRAARRRGPKKVKMRREKIKSCCVGSGRGPGHF